MPKPKTLPLALPTAREYVGISVHRDRPFRHRGDRGQVLLSRKGLAIAEPWWEFDGLQDLSAPDKPVRSKGCKSLTTKK